MLRRLVWRTIPAALGLAVLLVSFGTAQAQMERPPSGFGWRQGLPLHLIKYEAVQKELGMSAESVSKLTQIIESIGTDIKAEMQPHDLSGKNRGELYNQWETRRRVQAAYQPKLNEILSAEQQNRLEQIHLQSQHEAALSDPAVATELGLSFVQQDQIHSVHLTYISLEIAVLKSLTEVDRRMQEERKRSFSRNEEVMKVLSADQKAAFDKLKGKPVGFLR